jgi:fluoride exporter
MKAYWFVGLGSVIGGAARIGIAELFHRFVVSSFPWETLIANVSGSFLIGYLASIAYNSQCWLSRQHWRQFTMTGICGGYTTFSIFSWQTLDLWRDSSPFAALLYAITTLILCLIAVAAGDHCAQL